MRKAAISVSVLTLIATLLVPMQANAATAKALADAQVAANLAQQAAITKALADQKIIYENDNS